MYIRQRQNSYSAINHLQKKSHNERCNEEQNKLFEEPGSPEHPLLKTHHQHGLPNPSLLLQHQLLHSSQYSYNPCYNHTRILYVIHLYLAIYNHNIIITSLVPRPFLVGEKRPGHHCWRMHIQNSVKHLENSSKHACWVCSVRIQTSIQEYFVANWFYQMQLVAKGHVFAVIHADFTSTSEAKKTFSF